jgi:acetyl-CoA acetyltransferase
MEKAKQYTTQPIKIGASVLTSDPWSERDLTMFDVNTLTRNAAKEAYDKAGVDPKDLNVVELHDCFATAELLHYENLGLVGEGEAGRAIDEGEVTYGGKVVVAPSGGLLSKGHPLGATGVANVCEIVWHLRDQAGARQVEGAKVGLAHVIGLGSACTIHILQK